MKQLLLFLALMGISLTWGYAQGKVVIIPSPGIDQMVNSYIETQKSTPGVPGWRIQLLATTDRQEMESTLYRFRVLYPHIRVDWEHEQPYYKIRAGAFQTKLEAYRILYLIKQDYPGAYPAMDKTIQPVEFLY
jgi:hypothetical protein